MARIPGSLTNTGCWFQLEDNLRADLTDTARSDRSSLSKLSAVRIPDHAAGKEVGVIEEVEHFEAKIQRCRLGQFRVLFNSRVGVDGARTSEAVLRRTTGYTTNLVAAGQTAGEGCRIEEVIPVTGDAWKPRVTRVYFLDGTDLGRIVEPEVRQSKITAAS